MTRIDFYILQDVEIDAMHRFACRLATKAMSNGNDVHIHTANDAAAQTLDDLLWVYPEQRFVPHDLASDSSPAPINIGWQEPKDADDVLINLSGEVPGFFGRFDRVAEHPDVWIDVGHNPLGAGVIARALRNRGAGSGRRIRCVLAMLVAKDAEAVVEVLQPVIHSWYCAGLSGDRGQSGADLGRRVQSVVGNGELSVFERVEEALSAAVRDSSPEDGVLVFGSFHTADEADRMMIESQTGHGAKG